MPIPRLLATLLVFATLTPPANATPGTAWLDHAAAGHPDATWNRPGQAIPRAPAADTNELPAHRDDVRQPACPEDRAVAKAGWQLFASLQQFGPLVLIQGRAGVDGMGRSDPYQFFVFYRGRFLGTLSPGPMNARTDGCAGDAVIDGATTLHATYTRYKPEDPLCCPSGHTHAYFKLQQRHGIPTLVVDGAFTESTK